MKILIIHNKYQLPGGEDAVVAQESTLLSESDEVKILFFQNEKGVKGALQFFLSIWNVAAAAKIRDVINDYKPAIIHLHNWHYAIGPIVVRAAEKNKIPIVLTVHNYRLLCPSAILLHNGNLFLDSIHASFPWKAIKEKVYRNSYIQTFWLAFVIWFHKKIGTWKMVDRFILLTESAKNIFISSSLGINEKQISVKPNFTEDVKITSQPRENYFLFVGRLSEEKGINVLLEAFKNNNETLYIAGEGPLKEKVINDCKENARIKYLGALSRNEVQDLMSKCTALIFPSVWYEGMPMTLIESFAAGTPVIASNIGAMSSMVINKYNGLHFKVGNAADVNNNINYWQQLSDDEKNIFYKNARASFEKNYKAEDVMKQLKQIYTNVINKIPS